MSEFQKYLGGTDMCMKRLEIFTKWCDQLTSNDTYFDDSWFSFVKMAEEAMDAGVSILWAGEDYPQGFLSSYIRKWDERLAGRVIYCYEYYSKSSWW